MPEEKRPATGTSLGRVLIVDDEAAQLAALSNTLTHQGYTIVAASSGEEALTALHDQRFELLLTDLKLPGIDGIALLRAALSIDPNLVAVLMTGHGTITTAVEAMQVGALDYVLKPFKLSAVLPVLARALTVRRLRIENAELERRVRERSAELEAANKDLDAFASSVSHDLRAPLRAVTGFAGIVLQDYAVTLTPEVRELIELIGQAGQHGEQLVEDLLRFSKLGRQPLAKQTVDTESLVRAVVDGLHGDDPSRSVRVDLGRLPHVVGDPILLRQVFENLLSNAFKFTRERDDATVTVGCERRDTEFVFFVRDNGAGFDMRYAGKLFGVFQRLHTQEEFAGTGIGLSLVHRIIHRHGGRIWAEGQVGNGATFWFTLGA
jgi:two-component system sensor histidine kinase/response regulator